MKISSIKKNNNKVFVQKQITVHSDVHDRDYKFKIDTKFKKSKITKLFTDMGERAEECRKSGVVFSFALCQWAMLLNQFTDVEFETGNTLLDTYLLEVEGISNLIDAEILDKIVESLEQSELKKVEEVGGALSRFTKIMHDIEIDTLVNDIVGDEDGEV